MTDKNSNMVFRFVEPIGPNGGKVEAIGPDNKRYQFSLRPSDVASTSELTTYLAGYSPGTFRADDMSPIVYVDKSNFYYRTFASADAFTHVPVKISLTSPPPEIDPSSSTAEGNTIARACGSFVPIQTEEQADSFSPKAKAGKRCMQAILLDREKDVMDLMGTNTNWDSGSRVALGAGYHWNGGTSSDPIAALNAASEQSLQDITAYFMNRKIANLFLKHDKVRDHMRQFYGDATLDATLDMVNSSAKSRVDFRIPGIGTICVSSSKINVGAGPTWTLGDVVVGVHIPDSVPFDGEDICSSYSFRQKGEDSVGVNVREFWVDSRGTRGGYMEVVSLDEVAKMTGPSAGAIITGVYA